MFSEFGSPLLQGEQVFAWFRGLWFRLSGEHPANNADLAAHALPVGRLAVRLENPVGTHWRSLAFIRG